MMGGIQRELSANTQTVKCIVEIIGNDKNVSAIISEAKKDSFLQ